MTEAEWSSLLTQAVAGDKAALGCLLFECFDDLAHTLSRQLPDSLARTVSAEDVAQQAMIDALAGIKSFQPTGPDSFRAWLWTIGFHRLQSTVRAHQAVKRGGGGNARGFHRAGVK